MKENLEWWNNLLPTYNKVLFFDTSNRYIISLYTNACLYNLGGFFFEGNDDWPKATIYEANAFWFVVNEKTFSKNRSMIKDLDDPSINVHEVEAILLAFQLWAFA